MNPRPDAGAMEAASAAAEFAQRHCEGRLPGYIERLRQLTAIDSGPDDRAGRDRAALLLAAWGRAAGLAVELLDRPPGLFLRAALPGRLPSRVVLLGHHDTVYAHGTASERPLTVHHDIARGPGTADMKGGLLVALAVMEALLAADVPLPAVELHSVPDEEVRKAPFATMDLVRGADAALVFECGRENGNIVDGRKTGAWVRLSVHGRAAHAGTEPERGRNAALALCREALRCAALSGGRPGLTVTLTRLTAGTIPNVVPGKAEAVLDVRARLGEDVRWALEQMGRFAGYDGLRIELAQDGRWPGIEPSPAGGRLVDAAIALAAALGRPLKGETSGGMSDGCWTAAEGIPTLDGLGPVGADDHSPDERIDLTSVSRRCGIAAGLVVAVGNGLLSPSS